MARMVDPTVDCVFKAILGSEHHKGLLIHFLNAVLELEDEHRVEDVSLEDPFNPRQFEDGKMSVVDVMAKDQRGRTFQLEIQLSNHAALPERMLFAWSAIYHGKLDIGMNFFELERVVAIWLLVEDLFPVREVHLPFEISCREQDLVLSDHFQIHVLQLKQWPMNAKITTEKDRWISLFRHGKTIDLDNPPAGLDTEEMREAMNVMETFAEKGENYFCI